MKWILVIACMATFAPTSRGEDAVFKRAYPNPIPPDADFDTVVSSQPEYARVKYPVPIIGWADHPEEIHVTPEGSLVFPDPRNPSLCISPLVAIAGEEPVMLNPDNVRTSLVDGYKPGVQSEWSRQGLKIRQLAFGALLEGQEVDTGRETLLGLARFSLANESTQTLQGKLVLLLGKGGFHQRHKLVPPPYEGALSLRDRLLTESNGCMAAFLISSGGADFQFQSNRLEFPFSLAPGESRVIDLAVPYFPMFPEREPQLTAVDLDSRLSVFRSFWETELNHRAQFIIPEKRLRDAYRAWIAYNLILADRDPVTGSLLAHPDATEYESVWAGDASVMMQSMDRFGYFKHSEECGRYFLSRQGTRKPDGDVDSAEGFFPGDVGLRWLSENGFVLWALCQHYKLTGDREWLMAVAPRLVQSANWIVRERERTKTLVNGRRPRHWGLMVKGRSSDLDDWDYWSFTDCYSYMGIKDASDVLGDVGYADDARRIAAAAEDYKACILASIDASLNRNVNPPFVPLTPYKTNNPTSEFLYRYWYPITSPIYMVEAGVFDARSDTATWVNHWIEECGMVSGLCKVEPELIDPHYVYNQALSQLLRGETDKFVWTFYSLYAYGQSRDTYATVESVNIRTGIANHENWDDLRQPHMHSNSRCLAMLRIALLLEDQDKLHLMMGTPRGWLDSGKTIKILDAPTSFGNVSYTAESVLDQGKITVDIAPPARHAANLVLHVRPPAKFGPMQSALVDGEPAAKFTSDEIELGVKTNHVHVVCRFRPH